MNIKAKLDKALLNQSFEKEEFSGIWLRYRSVAKMYSEIENAICVLTDLKTRRSVIHYGGMSSLIGNDRSGEETEISSIWEDEILNKVHPEDVRKKQILEYYFFHFLKKIPIAEWTDYYMAINLRIRSHSAEYLTVLHRMFYAVEEDNVRLALCIYNISGNNVNALLHENGVIINSMNGTTLYYNEFKYRDILSAREKEILLLIAHGKMSKEIAESLEISLNTVNRHRQNILQKLQVKNSIEAYRLAKAMELV
ncbi:helix-turn-helix transcriptional regulator [Chryseobacterium indologenes]|uniref:response regulator transcription factor n=1 Tax=Chryseobacterium indologenes TaxID=253 RepID=UPI0023E85644|nr:helix-turn-helix transcriptional regulator [Chryseobacterium indologenes]WET50975.1 helix-turn-helix transcriptional regulator [Chryseobacterium indologenes]